MWIMTKDGFLSIVAFNPKKDKEKRSNRERKSWGSRPMLVRSRLPGDLEQLRPFWSKLRVYKDTSADYSARAIVPANRLSEFLAWLPFESIDYDSHFKEAARANSPGGVAEGNKRYSAYSSCWSALAKMQEDPPYGGYSSYGSTSYTGSSSSSAGGYWSSTENRWITTEEIRRRKEIADAQIPAVTSGASSINLDQPWNPDEKSPLTVKEMCEALLLYSPEDVKPLISTTYAALDIHYMAEDNYNTPIPLGDLINMLKELIDEPLTTATAREEYVEMLEELEEDLKHQQEESADGFGSVVDDIESLLEERGTGVLSTPEAP